MVVPALKYIKLKGHPESIVKKGESIYVSCLKTLSPGSKGKEGGFIVELNESGEIINENAFPGITLNSPRGMTLKGNILYVADGNRIVALDLKNRQKKKELAFPMGEGHVIADILVSEEGIFYAAFNEMKGIYVIDPTQGVDPVITKLETSVPIPGIHGLALHGDSLYVSGFVGDKDGPSTGQLWKVDIKTGDTRPISEEKGCFDGIDVFDGFLYFSNWDRGQRGVNKDGAIRKMNLETGEITDVTKIRLKGVADFYIDKQSCTIWIPALLERQVIFAPLCK